MELSRKETYRNQRVSIGVTLLSFIVMILFFVFTNVVTANSAATNNTQQFALNMEHGTPASSSSNDAARTSASVKGPRIQAAQAVTPAETGLSDILTKFTTGHASETPQNIIADMREPAGKERDSQTGPDARGPQTFNTLNPSIGYDLGERTLVTVPEFENTTQEQGRVVVDITVDKNGTVIEADPNGRGTTTSSSRLKREAAKMAFATKFNPQQKFEEQKGTITINFSFH